MQKYTVILPYAYYVRPPNYKGEEKIKVHFDGVKTSEPADIGGGVYEVMDSSESGGDVLISYRGFSGDTTGQPYMLVSEKFKHLVKNYKVDSESSENDVVKVFPVDNYEMLTYFCPICEKFHSVAVRKEGEQIAARSSVQQYWLWNGSRERPTLNSWCVKVNDCHCFIDGGVGKGYFGASQFNWQDKWTEKRLKPVKEWPGNAK